ncbi:jg1183 [Pararge aegeria aegeria]|uniref:Jg1183 protein n=1 Tax=Pararge aegeria aegeria TaxID=348720 RepID=A0A8S4QEM8_9NEOP|nr:jg1183 [Pararge aegeria aegeria]
MDTGQALKLDTEARDPFQGNLENNLRYLSMASNSVFPNRRLKCQQQNKYHHHLHLSSAALGGVGLVKQMSPSKAFRSSFLTTPTSKTLMFLSILSLNCPKPQLRSISPSNFSTIDFLGAL